MIEPIVNRSEKLLAIKASEVEQAEKRKAAVIITRRARVFFESKFSNTDLGTKV